jgi:hypothetical protein
MPAGVAARAVTAGKGAKPRDPFAVQLQPHLPRAVDPEVVVVDPADLRFQVLVADLTDARPAVEGVVVVDGAIFTQSP